ncbi:hypothetical protein E2C01_100130 [Portunus trituberculatus]|uniref:Uncharacterized protein n=1 Tax=Portunus trituberculatus TaxID=210409 RepID=A0A5B7K5X5_PORTR|nr:hypothetical protein [Portunus trituberculatus]
MGCRGTWPL